MVPSFWQTRQAMSAVNGWDVISDTDTHTGSWSGFFVAADAVFNAASEAHFGDAPDTTSLAAGTLLPWPLKTIKLDSGTIYAVRATG